MTPEMINTIVQTGAVGILLFLVLGWQNEAEKRRESASVSREKGYQATIKQQDIAHAEREDKLNKYHAEREERLMTHHEKSHKLLEEITASITKLTDKLDGHTEAISKQTLEIKNLSERVSDLEEKKEVVV